MVTSFRWEKLIYKLNRLVTVITLKTRKDCLPLFFIIYSLGPVGGNPTDPSLLKNGAQNGDSRLDVEQRHHI